MNYEVFVKEKFNTDRILDIVERELEVALENNINLSEEGLHVFDIVSGSYGRFQQETIAEFFGIELDEEGIADNHSFIKEVEDHLTSLINLSGSFYFSYLEADNSFGLFFQTNY